MMLTTESIKRSYSKEDEKKGSHGGAHSSAHALRASAGKRKKKTKKGRHMTGFLLAKGCLLEICGNVLSLRGISRNSVSGRGHTAVFHGNETTSLHCTWKFLLWVSNNIQMRIMKFRGNKTMTMPWASKGTWPIMFTLANRHSSSLDIKIITWRACTGLRRQSLTR